MMTGPSSAQRPLNTPGLNANALTSIPVAQTVLGRDQALSRSAQVGSLMPVGLTGQARRASSLLSAGQPVGQSRSALGLGRGWGLDRLVPSLRGANGAKSAITELSHAAAPRANAGGFRQPLGALGAILSQVVKKDSTVLFVTAAGALVGTLAWMHARGQRGDDGGQVSDPRAPGEESPSGFEQPAADALSSLAGDWVIRQHREYSAFTPPAINNHVCSTRYSTAHIDVTGEGEARMSEQLQLVEQGSKGLIKSRLASPIEAHTYPPTRELALKVTEEEGLVKIASSPFEETIGFEKSEQAKGPARFPDVGDRRAERIDPVSQKPLGYLAKAEVQFLGVKVQGRVRTMQILRGNLAGDVKDQDTLQGDLDLDYEQAVAYSDNGRIRDARPKDRFLGENSDWVAVRRPADWGPDWPAGRSREEQLADLRALFADQPLKPGAEERGQVGWGLDVE